eukprot:scaffold40659_cov71-Phaeocystis_antarctica.AAC.6
MRPHTHSPCGATNAPPARARPEADGVRGATRRRAAPRRARLGIGRGGAHLDAHHLLAVGHEDELDRLGGAQVRPVADVVAAPLELHDLAALQQAQRRLAARRVLVARLRREQLLDVVVLLDLVLVEQEVELDERAVDEVGRVGEPRELARLGLDVALQVQRALEPRHAPRGRVHVHALDQRVAPAHERHLLALGRRRGVVGLQQHPRREGLDLLAEARVLGVQRQLGHEGRGRARQLERHEAVGEQRRVPVGGRVDDVLVEVPQLVPLHEAGHRHAALQDAAHRREARVVPAVGLALVDDPLQLALGEERAHEVDAREAPQVDGPQPQRLDEPLVLRVAVRVLPVAQRVRHALDRVDDRAGQVVRGVDLVLVLGLVVRDQVGAEGARVAQRAVVVLHVDLGAHAALEALLGGLLHLAPQPEVLGHGLRAVLVLLLGHPLLLLLLLRRRVDVRDALLEHARLQLQDRREVVGGVAHRAGRDVEPLQVLDDRLLVLALLLARVGVVEAQQQAALVLRGEVRIEHRRLDVPDVQVAARLGREARDDLAHLGAGQRDLHVARVLVRTEELLRHLLHRLEALDEAPPARQVRQGLGLRLELLLVRAQGEPDGRVGQADRVPRDHGAHAQVAVDALQGLGDGRALGAGDDRLRVMHPVVCLAGGERVAGRAVEQRGLRLRRARQVEHGVAAVGQLLGVDALEGDLELGEARHRERQQRHRVLGAVQLDPLVLRRRLRSRGRRRRRRRSCRPLGRRVGGGSGGGGRWAGRGRGGGFDALVLGAARGLRGLLLGARRGLGLLRCLDVGCPLGVLLAAALAAAAAALLLVLAARLGRRRCELLLQLAQVRSSRRLCRLHRLLETRFEVSLRLKQLRHRGIDQVLLGLVFLERRDLGARRRGAGF